MSTTLDQFIKAGCRVQNNSGVIIVSGRFEKFRENGLEMEFWEYNTQEALIRYGLTPNTSDYKALACAGQRRLLQFTAMVDPDEDAILCIDEDGFTVNHGNVGSQGIRYDWDA